MQVKQHPVSNIVAYPETVKGRLSIRRPNTIAIETIHKCAKPIIFTFLEQMRNLLQSLFAVP